MRMKPSMEHALYALIILSMLPSRSSLSAEAISKRLDVSTSYFKKQIRQLVTAGLVKSTPGINGGFSLALRPSEISMLDVFQAVEGRGSLFQEEGIGQRVIQCDSDQCILTGLMERAERAWNDELAKESLEDMLTKAIGICSEQHVADLKEWIRSEIS
ncbi:Rrf2 family transcriptional regulator [Hazenella sp. IB182353]|uniref:RrF2 family transcriptional regulator n=1 Tax=Polycladospora coralii TaxID=2771432 RepID=UPI00174697C0|nr:Rrf2 family transcriptional regulator [Polycladospora coralii]MBS7529007.1 Rrf2 family transcriptional regulator [Polycladospora coralii]